ncbi:MAG TPA: ClpXP protease specificity-enhancing factor SspB [Rhizomicrobium sp.]|nr:ClpXP protease specificity-enhancing factor SspB [Rhizomicrobium sp.]
MTKDFIGYQALTEEALRGVVREAMRHAETNGLVAAHHFYLTFKTTFPGVEIPDFLREQYPEEMTIILQHQFWGLKVDDDAFEVSLTFRKVPATLYVPFAALTAFMDPGVQFTLQFQPADESLGEPAAPSQTPSNPPTKLEGKPPEAKPDDGKAPAGQGDGDNGGESAPATPGEVVSLDAFRKK